MIAGHPNIPTPMNEPIKTYAPGSAERSELQSALARAHDGHVEIPVVVGGQRHKGSGSFEVRAPHAHRRVIATAQEATPAQMEQAIASALRVKSSWAELPFHQRAAIFLKAADLLAGKYRARINAVTMAGQSKTAYQAEIDAACESIDFLRFNVAFAEQLMRTQPVSAPGMWNQTDYRPLDGFVFAVAPFNFTAIALNLCAAPALMGNVVVFKPAETASLSSWVVLDVLREAGLPEGVIQFLPGRGPVLGPVALQHPDLGAVHFTGSTGTFNAMWKTVGDNMARYRQYPRMVGETGGKDFIFVHPSASADLDAVAVAIARGGFEFQGQKCSACSRVYVPQSLWPSLKERLVPMVKGLKQGDVSDFSNFLSAVIDERSFEKCVSYQALGKQPGASTLVGGGASKTEGFFVEPTVIQVEEPGHRLMREEIFGPVVSLWVYPDAQLDAAVQAVDQTAAYALTGAIFARDRHAIESLSRGLRHAAGNFYINDKPTGAVVGQQPFGGSRASGTNDKAGSLLNLVRWTSPRTIKETFVPPTEVGYPVMASDANERKTQ
jgi:1-pyrroline-5-carboxylate dehydrogenase